VKSTPFSVRLNFEKELRSTVWGREFQQFINRSLRKLARTRSLMVWRLKNLNLKKDCRLPRNSFILYECTYECMYVWINFKRFFSRSKRINGESKRHRIVRIPPLLLMQFFKYCSNTNNECICKAQNKWSSDALHRCAGVEGFQFARKCLKWRQNCFWCMKQEGQALRFN